MTTYQTVMFFLCFGMGLFFMYKFWQLFFISLLPKSDIQHDIIQPPASLVFIGIIVCIIGIYRNSSMTVLGLIPMMLLLFTCCLIAAAFLVKPSKKIRPL